MALFGRIAIAIKRRLSGQKQTLGGTTFHNIRLKELSLISVLPPHHSRLSRRFLSRNHGFARLLNPFFDSIDPKATLVLGEVVSNIPKVSFDLTSFCCRRNETLRRRSRAACRHCDRLA
jgi:hypothetical protein